MIGWLLLGGAALLIAGWVLWDWIDETISSWLYDSGLDESIIGRAWFKVSKQVNGTKAQVKVFLRKKGWMKRKKVNVSTTTVDTDDLPDDIQAELQKRNKVEQDYHYEG